MWFILAILSAIVFGLSTFCMKVSSARQGEISHTLWGLFMSGSIGFAIWMFVANEVQINLAVIIGGVIVGLGAAFGNLLFMKALEFGPASLTSPLINTNIILIVIGSVYFYGETLSTVEIFGIVLLLFALSLITIEPNESFAIKNKIWYVLVLSSTILFAFRNGGLKVTEELYLPGSTVLFFGYFFSFITFFVYSKVKNLKAIKLNKKIGFIWGLLAGIFSFIGLQLYVFALRIGPASIVAPIFALNGLVVAVLSILVFSERLSKLQILALLLLFIGLVLIRL